MDLVENYELYNSLAEKEKKKQMREISFLDNTA